MSLVPYKRQANQRNKRVDRHRLGRVDGVAACLRPPAFLPNPHFTRKVRFGCSSTGGYNVTPKACGNAIGVMCTSTTSASTLITAFRLKRVQIWGVAAQSGITNTVALTWFGDQTLNFESNREVSDSSTSTAYVPYIDATPPKRSSAADWQAVGGSLSSAVLFSINLPSGSIIDCTFEVVLADGAASPTAATAISGGTAGTIKYGPLDGYGGGQLPATQVTSM